MTALRVLTGDAWATRVEKVLSDGYFVRDHSAVVQRYDDHVAASRGIVGWSVAVMVRFNEQGETTTEVMLVNTESRKTSLPFGEAMLLSTLLACAGRSAEFIDRTFKHLRVQNATVVSAEPLDATLAATGRPVTPRPFYKVAKWGVCPVPGCGKLTIPRRIPTASGGYRNEWHGRYCEHGPFEFDFGGIRGVLPEVGQPATVQVGSDTYAATVMKVAASGKTIFLQRAGRQEVEKATWREARFAYCIIGSRGLWVTIGEATSYRAPEV